MNNELQTKEGQHFFRTYKRLPLHVEKAEGCYIFTKDGKKYLDMLAGIAVNPLGNSHPAIIKAITEQSKKYIHLSNFFIQEPQVQLAEKLLTYAKAEKIFFSNSGTEATEAAIKLARKWGKAKNKTHIYGMSNGFSGRTMGALSIMDKEKYRDGYEPFLPNCGVINFNDVKDVKKKVNENTAAIILECIQGEGGIVSVTSEFITILHELREKYNFLIIADEIQAGIGRTGKIFSYEHFGLVPDVITLAKPIGGGLPLGAIIGTKKVADVWTYGTHGTTFGGNPVACAAGLAVLDIIEKEKLLNHVQQISQYFVEKLNALKTHYSIIKEIRGFGLMLGIELTQESAPIVEKMLQYNVIANATAVNVIRIVPPLIITQKEIDEFLTVFEKVIRE